MENSTRPDPQGPPAARFRSPGLVILLGTFFCLLVLSWTTLFALSTPWLGVQLAPDFETGELHVVKTQGPAEQVPAGTILVGVGNSEEFFPVSASDLMEEPDFFDTYEEMAEFFGRQTKLESLLQGSEVHLQVRSAVAEDATAEDAPPETFRIRPASRPLDDLPLVYWFQCFAGIAGFLIGLWVLALSPRSGGARLFAAMGCMFLVFTITAAPYSTRELAIHGTTFRVLSALNHSGAFLFGAALVGLFTYYPKPLVSARWLLVIPAVIVPWLLADIFRLAPNQDIGSRLPIMAEMLVATGLAGVQWFATRKDPRGRAALRWLGSSVIIGPGLFVFVTVGSTLIGWLPPIRQGYAFGFFLLMDVGLAFGLRRHSLLGIDEWALRILMWLGAGIALVLLDVALVVFLGTSHGVSLGLSLAICGLVYLPVRNWLWEKIVVRKRLDQHELFRRVLDAAFAPRPEERAKLWVELLDSVFDPLEIQNPAPLPDPESSDPSARPAATTPSESVQLERQGLRLRVPAIGSLPAVCLDYPWRGRALFTPRHLRLAASLAELLRRAESARNAFLRGVLEERQRIARDLHDHLGAQLLTGLYASSAEEAREGIRHALADMRSVVHELSADEDPKVADVFADLRHETAERFRPAGIELQWPVQDIDPEARISPRVFRALTAMARELVSNVIRHSRATRVFVDARVDEGYLRLLFADNGVGIEAAQSRAEPAAVSTETTGVRKSSHGLVNLRHRAEQLRGSLRVTDLQEGGDLPAAVEAWLDNASQRGTFVEIQLPLTDVLIDELAS